MDNWISVETVPLHHKDVLMIDAKGICCVGFYTKGHEVEFGDDDYDGEYDEVEEKNGCLYLKPGWYELEETPSGQYDEAYVKREPTYWMPLPPKPSQP